MKKIICIIALCATAFMVSSCFASRMSQSQVPMEPNTKVITINSNPQGAAVYMEGKYLGVTPMTTMVPLKYQYYTATRSAEQLMAKSEELSSSTLIFIKEGYEKQEVIFKPTITPLYSGVKNYNGLLLNLDFVFPEGVFCSLERSPQYVNDPTIPAGAANEVVSRDNAGGTTLESTIIRWFFDSAPRGARVFWRVISSVPEEVKNTNELYLGPTPFEETRSFNILGLTYANSRDVQIEVKVTKNGYMDQVKRFNVRQAIDQQEISSFFELVPAE